MAVGRRWSFGETFVFWWLLFLVIQQAQRLTLMVGTALREPRPPGVLAKTLATGLRADLVVAGFGIVAALLIAGLIGSVVIVIRAIRRAPLATSRAYKRPLAASSAVLALMAFLVLTVDMGYYRYSHSRLDFVFLEYVSDVLDQLRHGSTVGAQVGRQTTAEASDLNRWLLPVAGYLALEAGAIAGWWWAFARRLRRSPAVTSGIAHGSDLVPGPTPPTPAFTSLLSTAMTHFTRSARFDRQTIADARREKVSGPFFVGAD